MSFSEKLKTKIKKQAHLSCCLCKAIGVEVHHIIPQSEGGSDTEDNAAPLCPSCHEVYGANPEKRKFIREARELWYEICEKRFAADSDRLDEIKRLLHNTVSYDDFQIFKDELLASVNPDDEMRSQSEVLGAMNKFFEKVWYNRHTCLKALVERGTHKVDSDIWEAALKAAKAIEERHPEGELGPWTDFDWGVVNGKLSAARWVLGDEWDMLDT